MVITHARSGYEQSPLKKSLVDIELRIPAIVRLEALVYNRLVSQIRYYASAIVQLNKVKFIIYL